MSAQRRTGTKSSSGAATVASRPTVPPPTAPAPSTRPPKPAADKAKAQAPAQPSVFATRTEALRRLARDTWSEAKKVNWPDRETTRNLTIVVIGISVIMGLFLGGLDWLFVKLLHVS
ncbi:MAG TPA: preprotein translocase subunit SecE [Thermomicrobiales bacterium]